WRSREGANAVGKADHSRSASMNFKHFTHAAGAQFFLVELVQDDGIGRIQVFDSSLPQIPGPAHRGVHVEADDLNRFFAAIGTLPLGPVGNIFFRLAYALDGSHLIQPALAERDPLF